MRSRNEKKKPLTKYKNTIIEQKKRKMSETPKAAKEAAAKEAVAAKKCKKIHVTRFLS